MTSVMFEVHLVRGHEVEELNEAALNRLLDEDGELAPMVVSMNPLEGAIVIEGGDARTAIIDELTPAIARLCFEAVSALIGRPSEAYSYRYFNADATAEITPDGTSLVLSGRYIPTSQHRAEELLVALYRCGTRYLGWLERLERSGHASATADLAHLRPLAEKAHAAAARSGWA